MDKAWEKIINHQPLPNSIAPLFWQHGESESVLREEIRQMRAGGIGSFIIESRPHPDFLGERWWHDLDVILDEARKQSMQVWIFDERAYPSGFAAGLIKETHPEYLKLYLTERHIDPIGPLSGSSFFINAWIEEGEALVRVIAAQRLDRADRFDAGTLIDLTIQVVNGILYWDVPDGDWRIFILASTRNGGEEWTKDYLNPLMPEAVQAYLDFVYEPHYAHYADQFGGTIAGFFSDEPRFGNAATYEAALGKVVMVLPYAPDLLSALDQAWGGDFSLYLPCLWYDGGPQTSGVRFTYMDSVSRLFGTHLSQKIGTWCRAHGVRLIGHIVEDNGAHARLGYGPGHFFRAISGQDMSGLDVVYQVWPGYSSGRFTTPIGYLDADFFYWGIAKMASSAGHIDPKKDGMTVCEVFGAYGWQEGLKLMKWLTDHICVRGVNFIIPHAFSPKAIDPDCPPHFYARGLNPQWRYFHHWSAYANRLCQLLSGGTHVAPVAVLYHAEAEWAGDYEPFERVVKTLAQRQIDSDVLPVDTLVDREALRLSPGGFQVNRETYRALIIPYAERLPDELMRVLTELAEHGVPVIFMRDYPKAIRPNSENFDTCLERLKRSPQVKLGAHDTLVERLKSLNCQDVEAANNQPSLRYYHYVQDGTDIYFFTNEDRSQPVHTTITLRSEVRPVGYDAMDDRVYPLVYSQLDGRVAFDLDLEPYESFLVIFDQSVDLSGMPMTTRIRHDRLKTVVKVNGDWKISRLGQFSPAGFIPEPLVKSLGNISVPSILPQFSGTLRYETTFQYTRKDETNRILLDLGEVYEIGEARLNGQLLGARICPPYVFETGDSLRDGENVLQVDVTNTLAKRYGSLNVFDRSMSQEPSGLLGPVRLMVEQPVSPEV